MNNRSTTRNYSRRPQKKGFFEQLKRMYAQRPKPLWMVCVIHILVLGLSLVVFSYFHHARSYERKAVGTVSERNAYTAPLPAEPVPSEAEEAAMPAPEAEPEQAPVVATAAVGDFSQKYADKFVEGAPVFTENGYIGNNISITMSDHVIPGSGKKADIRYYVADIYLRDISCLHGVLSKDKFGQNITENILNVSKRTKSVLTMNGDFYGLRTGGCCMRDGVLYVDEGVVRDICVLYWDGRMQCYDKDTFNADPTLKDGAYQIWNFGPALLDENGKRKENYDAAIYEEDVAKNQPRSAFGYYEPGHYCFVVVDGRSEKSRGMTVGQLAALAEELQLTQLYNMDGGRTAQLAFCAAKYNDPGTGTRNCSDYICIIDEISK